MKLALVLVSAVALAVSLSGCGSLNYPTSSRVPETANARVVAKLIDRCSDIAREDHTAVISGDASQAEILEVQNSLSLVTCTYGGTFLEVSAYKLERDARSAFDLETTQAGDDSYILYGPRWSVRTSGTPSSDRLSLDDQKSVLAQVQADLGGEIVQVDGH